MSEIMVRHVTPEDAAALMHIYSQPDTMANTLQLPLPSLQKWQQRLSNLSPTGHSLVACIEEKVVGQLTLEILAPARRRHCATAPRWAWASMKRIASAALAKRCSARRSIFATTGCRSRAWS